LQNHRRLTSGNSPAGSLTIPGSVVESSSGSAPRISETLRSTAPRYVGSGSGMTGPSAGEPMPGSTSSRRRSAATSGRSRPRRMTRRTR
jgi:hypothetical protein